MKITLQVPFTCLMLSLSHVSFNVFEKMCPPPFFILIIHFPVSPLRVNSLKRVCLLLIIVHLAL